MKSNLRPLRIIGSAQDDCYSLQRIQAGPNPVAGIGIDHTKTLVELLRQPGLKNSFFSKTAFILFNFML